jgi:hypothetical protein
MAAIFQHCFLSPARPSFPLALELPLSSRGAAGVNVIISYTTRDIAAMRRIKRALRALGLTTADGSEAAPMLLSIAVCNGCRASCAGGVDVIIHASPMP